ncbi:hypothetical protein GBAR_LOCUS1290 [Geodia barretti]|uniref:Uncharacterized protein n=1 Tax=Geodia barretti TaxID=519541 RepID=A0AA35QVC0_GEOBA|nr:hypothetical protein GBAR_LOCUS1290 [Geodia barretti]
MKMTGYLEEIRKMMYVCGDIVQPSTESAGLVEAVTQQQIVQLVRSMYVCTAPSIIPVLSLLVW